MFTHIDHVTLGVADLEQGTAQLRRLGFHVQPGGVHEGRGTHNALAWNDEDYLELLAIRDAAEYRAASRTGASFEAFIAAGGGIHSIALASDDLEADVAAMRGRGIAVSDVLPGSRTTPDGRTLRWKLATLDPVHALPFRFIQHLTPLAERRPSAAPHPNAVHMLERSYIVVADAEAKAAECARILGFAQPPLQKGTVIMSNMAIFQLGSTGLGIVSPYADGPARKALQSRGPGAFQALYRTTSMGAAARWMAAQGMPPLERGVRNTGEHAMLAAPAEACGAYIGFVGPE
ncbi:MAG: VOC family protein [Betaproteobacteria bacterium]|nr:VOC family protein [Betaproteobacteria bacterium]